MSLRRSGPMRKCTGAGSAVRSESAAVIAEQAGQTVTTIAAGSAGDVDAAVTAARAAFPTWRDTSARERSRILHRVSVLIRERAGESDGPEGRDSRDP